MNIFVSFIYSLCRWAQRLRHHWLSIDILFKKIDSLMACTACLVCLASSLSGCCKNSLWKASMLRGQSGLPNLFKACVLCFVPATSTLVLLKWMFHKLICVEQSTFLWYLRLSYSDSPKTKTFVFMNKTYFIRRVQKAVIKKTIFIITLFCF